MDKSPSTSPLSHFCLNKQLNHNGIRGILGSEARITPSNLDTKIDTAAHAYQEYLDKKKLPSRIIPASQLYYKADF